MSGVSGAPLLPNANRDERCRRIIFSGGSKGVCDCNDCDDARETGSESGGVAGDFILPVSLLASFFRGDIDLDRELLSVVPLLVRLEARLPFSDPLGGVAR